MPFETFYADDTSRMTLTAGSPAVTAETGLFAIWARPGDRLIYKGLTAIIASIESNTAFTLSRGWPGATAENITDWEIDRGPMWGQNVPIHTDVTEILRRIRAGIPFRPDAFGTLADRAQYDGANDGFIFQRIDVNPFEIYVKNAASAGGWAGPETLRGDTGPRGFKGWSPIWAAIVDGTRVIVEVSAWQGGEGDAPPAGLYLGAAGFVATKADAIDFRGPEGDVKPAVTALVERAETAAGSAGTSATAAAGSASAAAGSAAAAQAAAGAVNPSVYVTRASNGGDFTDKDAVLGNLGAGATGKILFKAATIAQVKTALGRYANADLVDMPVNTVKGCLTPAGPPQDLTPAQILQMLGFSLTDLVPTGSILDWNFTVAPSGWLIMYGQLVSRAAYPKLWALVQGSARLVTDAAWGNGDWGCFSSGDGSTTFRLPETRGEFIRVADNGRGIDSGRQLGSSQTHALQQHTHKPSQGVQFVTNTYPSNVSWMPTVGSGSLNMNGGEGTGGISDGYNTALETRPRSIAWHKIIKVV